MASTEVMQQPGTVLQIPTMKPPPAHGKKAATKTHHLQLVSSEEEQQQPQQGLEATLSLFDRTVCLRPGRRGGRFQLPEGGRVAVPEGAFGRSQTLEVAAVQPAELPAYCPPLAELESVVSPVYEVASSLGRLPCRLKLALPLLRPEAGWPPLTRLRLLHRGNNSRGDSGGDDSGWRELPSDDLPEDAVSASLDVDHLGTYLAVLTPLEEPLEVTPAGGIVHLKLDPIASLRVPKNAFVEPGSLKFSILPFSPERSAMVRELHRSETQDILSVSPMYDFAYDGPPCRRGLTVKLPLPEWMHGVERGNVLSRLAIMSKQRDSWSAIDAKRASVRLTRKSISFECRQLARFCFVEAAAPQWLPRAAVGFQRFDALNAAEPGQLLLFTAFEPRRWALRVDCVPDRLVAERLAELRVAGSGGVDWRPLEKRQPRQSEVQQVLQQLRLTRRRGRATMAAAEEAVRQEERSRKVEAPMRDGETFTVQLAGDFCLRHVGDTQAREEVRLQYHRQFNDRPALFEIAPTARTATIASDFYDYLLELAADSGESLDDEKLVDRAGKETLTFKGVITVLRGNGEQLSTHEFSVGFQALKEYLDLKPPPPPESEEPQEDETTEAQERQKPSAPEHPAWYVDYPRILDLRIYRLKPEEAKQESRQRLFSQKRNARPILHPRESKALSRQSLQLLAQRVGEGVELAAQLGLPEGAVSVLSFEAIPGGLGPSSSVAYRVLLYWKRASPIGDAQVDQLTEALDRMGRRSLADAVRDGHAENRELTADRLPPPLEEQHDDNGDDANLM